MDGVRRNLRNLPNLKQLHPELNSEDILFHMHRASSST